MALPAFTPPVNPSFGVENAPRVRVLQAEFGDGYNQRAEDGLNSVADVLTVPFNNITPADAATIEAFFKSMAGAQAFTWRAPWDAVARKWICKRWSRKRNVVGERLVSETISATFEEVFDL